MFQVQNNLSLFFILFLISKQESNALDLHTKSTEKSYLNQTEHILIEKIPDNNSDNSSDNNSDMQFDPQYFEQNKIWNEKSMFTEDYTYKIKRGTSSIDIESSCMGSLIFVGISILYGISKLFTFGIFFYEIDCTGLCSRSYLFFARQLKSVVELAYILTVIKGGSQDEMPLGCDHSYVPSIVLSCLFICDLIDSGIEIYCIKKFVEIQPVSVYEQRVRFSMNKQCENTLKYARINRR